MKKNVPIQLFLFLLPLMLLSPVADKFVSEKLKRSNSFAEKEYPTWNALFDQSVDSDIVIYGSSRAWVHLNTTMIENAFNVPVYNLGIDGHNFWLQYFRHRLLMESAKRPKVVIHSVDMFTLQKNKDLYNLQQFLPYMLGNKRIDNVISCYNGFTLFDFYLPFVRYYGQHAALEEALHVDMAGRNQPQRIRGYQGLDKPWNDDLEKARKEMKSFHIIIDRSTVMLFEKYLQECRSKNIKVIFVYTPEYKDGQRFVRNRKQVMDIFRSFSKKYHIPFYDYSDDEMSYNKKYFYNASHLNKKGSEIFTARFIDTLKVLKPPLVNYK